MPLLERLRRCTCPGLPLTRTTCTGSHSAGSRLSRADARANIGMTVAFVLISILGVSVFFSPGLAGAGPSARGKLELASQPGRDTTVRVRLPAVGR
jgi:hypothetical protein